MNIKIIAVGKLKEKYFKDGILEYAKRLSNYCKFEIIEVADEKTLENMSDKESDLIKEKEANRILSKISDTEFVIALAIEGQLVSSEQMAEQIEKCAINGKSKITYIIGGSLGLANSVKKRADYLLSFGRITMPHQMVRLVLSEQIYRSYRIINNQAYHK